MKENDKKMTKEELKKALKEETGEIKVVINFETEDENDENCRQ